MEKLLHRSKHVISPQISLRFNVIPTKFPTGFTVDTDKMIPKFMWKCKGPRFAKTTFKNKNKVG